MRWRLPRGPWGVIVVAAVIAGGAWATRPFDGPAPAEGPPAEQTPLPAPAPADSLATGSAAQQQPGPRSEPARRLPPPSAPPPLSLGLPVPELTGAAYLVMDAASGAVLFERNADQRLAPASLTKIVTALLVIEAGGLDEVVTVNANPDHYWLADASTMKLVAGEQFVVRDLLLGLMLVSANDAADELALRVAGSIPAFVERMNGLVAELGLENTRFIDPHGLGGEGHYTTARDLAHLTRYAFANPEFAALVATEFGTVRGSREETYENFNPLLGYTPGVDGVKTGYTEEAGPTFVLSATREGHRVIIVMLNAPGMIWEGIALVEWAFANHRWP